MDKRYVGQEYMLKEEGVNECSSSCIAVASQRALPTFVAGGTELSLRIER